MKKYKRAYKSKDNLPIYESKHSDVVRENIKILELRKYEPQFRFRNLVRLFRDNNIIKAYFIESGDVKYMILNKSNKVSII
jgi:replicative superfamily II helicase